MSETIAIINYSTKNLRGGIVEDPVLASNFRYRVADGLENIGSLNINNDHLLSVHKKSWLIKNLGDTKVTTVNVDHLSINNLWLNCPVRTLTQL